MLYDSFRAMNTDVLVAAEGESAEVENGFRSVREYIQAAEARFSRFRPDSELSELNRSAGGWRKVSADMFEVIDLAMDCAAAAEGLFDPTILDVLEAVGYDRSMDLIRASGPGAARRVEHNVGALAEVQVDRANQAVCLPHGVGLDLGGIAKGWIAERAVSQLKLITPVCAVNAGGDMVAAGVPEEGAWRVALEDPLNPERTLVTLRIGPGALATSSVAKRAWIQDGQPRHHIIDPRTAQPAVTDWLSMTVVTPQAAVAEVYAKALLIAGKRATRAVADASPYELSFIGVDTDGLLWGSEGSGRIAENGLGGYGQMDSSRSLRAARV